MATEKPFNFLWIVLGLAGLSIVLGVCLLLRLKPDGNPPVTLAGDGDEGVVLTGATNSPVVIAKSSEKDNKLKQVPRIYRTPLDPEATKRLSTGPKKIKTILETKGRAENANWGVNGMCSFVLTYSIDCDAEIVSKTETPGGEIKVIEKRTFNAVRESLQLSEADVAFALYETLPLDQTFKVMQFAGGLMYEFGTPTLKAIGEGLTEGSLVTDQVLKKIDGKNARALLKGVGIDVPREVEDKVNEFVNKKVKDIFKLSDLDGKSYLITYYQKKDSGKPVRVDFMYADGRGIETQEEFLVLRRANAFMDANFVPDKNCSPGDSWTIDSSAFDCILDPYVDGAYCGDVTVERRDDAKGGDWVLGIRCPCNVSVMSDQGRTDGELRIESGEAKVDAKNVFVKEMKVSGTGAMNNLTPHHLLFKSRFDGNCTFTGVLTTEEIRK